MLTVPSFILRRLYVKGSLRNINDGFQFDLCNKLGAGYARKLLPIVADGQPAAIERCSFHAGGAIHSFQEVSNHSPFTLALNKTTVITVRGQPLAEGPHTIGMSFEVPGLGLLKFDFTDLVAHG